MSRFQIVPRLAKLVVIAQPLTEEQIEALMEAGIETTDCAAVMLGADAAASMVAFHALKAGALEPVGQDPKRQSPLAPKSTKQYLKRADGQILDYNISLQVTHTAKTDTSAPDILD